MAADRDNLGSGLRAELVERTRAHYRERFAAHGATPQGVDWNGLASQRINFEQVAKVLPAPGPEQGAYSVNDLGCGYAALLDHLIERGDDVRYRGYDLNEPMIEDARRRHASRPNAVFDVADAPLAVADYGIACGIYTLRLGRSDDDCMAGLQASLDALADTSTVGFAFNALTSWSDADRMRDYLWYPDPCVVFALCKRRYAKDVALLHDYGLYAFTMLVRKQVPA